MSLRYLFSECYRGAPRIPKPRKSVGWVISRGPVVGEVASPPRRMGVYWASRPTDRWRTLRRREHRSEGARDVLHLLRQRADGRPSAAAEAPHHSPASPILPSARWGSPHRCKEILCAAGTVVSSTIRPPMASVALGRRERVAWIARTRMLPVGGLICCLQSRLCRRHRLRRRTTQPLFCRRCGTRSGRTATTSRTVR